MAKTKKSSVFENLTSPLTPEGAAEVFEKYKSSYKDDDVTSVYSTLFILSLYNPNLPYLEFFLEHKEEFEEKDYIASMELHFMIAIINDNEEYIEQIKEEYLSAPYINQEVEEELRDIEKLIENQRKIREQLKPTIDPEVSMFEVKNWLKSDKFSEIEKGLVAAYQFANEGIYMKEYIDSVLKEYKTYNLAFFDLFNYLMRFGYDATYKIRKNCIEITLNTTKIFEKFESIQNATREKFEHLSSITKDPLVIQMCNNVSESIFYNLIPEYLDDFDVDAYVFAVIVMCSDMYHDVFKLEKDPVYKEFNSETKENNKYLGKVHEFFEITLFDAGDELNKVAMKTL